MSTVPEIYEILCTCANSVYQADWLIRMTDSRAAVWHYGGAHFGTPQLCNVVHVFKCTCMALDLRYAIMDRFGTWSIQMFDHMP